MEKNIKDYLHLYLGCEIKYRVWSTVFNKYSYPKEKLTAWLLEHILHSPDHDCPEPILRPLSDMKDEERIELHDYYTKHESEEKQRYLNYSERFKTNFSYLLTSDNKFEPIVFKYLLSKRFDLFGLIESGLAIDATKINQSEKQTT